MGKYQGKSSNSSKVVGLGRTALLAMLLSTSAFVPLSYANPEGGQVVGGSATISESGKKLDVHQHTERTVIDWRSFNIDVDEHTEFHQPSSTATALNRVKSNDPSRILGKLTANGNVILVNPNGVFFGRDSVVDVNGLVATTADIDTAAFMAGGNHFNITGRPDAAIVNEGTITAKEAGLVGLVAPNVENHGVINARMGRVQLASGDTVVADFYGDGLLKVEVTDENVKSQFVGNTGRLEAEGGTVAMTAAAARQTVNALIVAKGELKAPSVSKRGGKIVIAAAGSNKTDKRGESAVIVQGLLEASGRDVGERGGNIEITGDNVALLDGTLIDASGHSGKSETTKGKKISDAREGSAGGEIKIGGDYLGQGDTQTAKNLYVDAGALILNDSLHEGDAGRTIFWSDDTTQFYGNVYARALGGKAVNELTWNATTGGNAGDGGFVETSGKIHLDAGGYVDLTASNGDRGTYFLDPTNITIYGNFDPTDVSGLQLWLDGSDQATMFSDTGGTTQITNGGSVARWNDKSGNGRDVSQSTLANRPTWNSNAQNGLGNITFGGTSVLSRSTNLLGGSNDVSFFGTTTPGASQPQYSDIIDFSHGGGGFVIQQYDSQTNNFTFTYRSGGAYPYFDPSQATQLSASQPQILSFVKNGGTVNHALNDASTRVNTGGGATIDTSNSTLDLNIGAWSNGGRNYNGTISELILYNTAVSDLSQDLLNQYQSAKWGIRLTPPGVASVASDLAEANAAMTHDAGDPTKGYSVFTTDYLERLSLSANISLQASNNITLDLQGDTLNFSTSGRSLTLTAGNQINTASAGTITTNNGAINLTGTTGGINFSHAIGLNSNGGNITFNNAVTSSTAQSWNAGTGNLTFNNTYTGTSGNLTLSAAQMDINNTLNVGTHTLTLKPTTAKAIRVGRSTDNGDDATYLDISAAELGRIQAGTVSIGDAALASATTIAGNLDLTGTAGAAGTYNLAFNTAGTFDSSGYTVNLGRDALSFDGSDDFVVAANNIGISGDPTFTISGWYNFSDPATYYGVMGWGDVLTASGGAGFFYDLRGTNVISGEFAGARPAFVNTPTSADSWHHVVMVKTPGAINATTTLYVDGVNLGTLNAASASESLSIVNSPLYIGQWGNYAADRFVGMADDVRVYNTALNASAISALYNGGAGAAFASESGLRAGYNFSEGTGTSTADASGISGTATLTNGPSWVRAQNLTVNAGGAVTMGAAYGDGSDISVTGSAVTLAGKVAAMGDGTLNVASTNNITINSGASANSGGTGNSLVLRSSAGNFINNHNSSALSAANGRWIVYSQSAGANTLGGLTAAQTINSQTYGTLAPAAITGPTYNASQNTFVYNSAPAGGILRFTADNKTRDYGDVNPTFTYSFYCSTGCTAADAVTGTPTLSTTATQGSDVTDYSISIVQGALALTGAFSAYTFDFVDGLLTVDPREVTAALQGTVSKVYDRSLTAALSAGNYVLNNVYSTDDVVLNNPASGTYDDYNVGTGKTVSVTGLSLSGAKASNYTLASTSISGTVGTITAKALSILGLSGVNKEYNRSTTATLSGTGTLSGVETGDTVTLGGTYTANFADWDVGNTKPLTVSGYTIGGAHSGNYSITQPTSLTANITPKTLTAGLTGTVSKTYNGNDLASLALGNYTLSGAISGDTVALNSPALGTYDDKHAGTVKNVTVTGLSLVGGQASNYQLASNSVSSTIGTILAKTLSILGITAQNKVYDGTTTASVNAGSATFSGQVSGDDVSLNSGTLSANFIDKDVGTGKSISVSGFSLSGADANNYALDTGSFVGTTANITQRSLAITADAKTKTYGASDPGFTYSYGTLATGDTSSIFTGSLSRASGNDVGTYAIGLGSLSAGGNYNINYTGANLTINPASLIITANNTSRAQALPNPSFTVNYSGFQYADNASVLSGLNVTTDALISSVPGAYRIIPSGATASNYTISYGDGTITISPFANLPSSWEGQSYGNSAMDAGENPDIQLSGFTSSGGSLAPAQISFTIALDNNASSSAQDNDTQEKDAVAENTLENQQADETKNESGIKITIEASLARTLGITQEKINELFK